MNPWELILRYPIEYFHANQCVTFLIVNFPLRYLISGNEFTLPLPITPHSAISTKTVSRHVSHLASYCCMRNQEGDTSPTLKGYTGRTNNSQVITMAAFPDICTLLFPPQNDHAVYILIEYLYRLSYYPNNKLSVILS